MESAFPSVSIDASIESNLAAFPRPGVLSVRFGYSFADHWITDRPAIIVTVDGASTSGKWPAGAGKFPADVDGIPVEIRVAPALKVKALTSEGEVVNPTPDGGTEPGSPVSGRSAVSGRRSSRVHGRRHPRSRICPTLRRATCRLTMSPARFRFD